MLNNIIISILLVLLAFNSVSCSNTVQANLSAQSEETSKKEEAVLPGETEMSEEEKTKTELERKLAEREELEKQRKEKLGEFYVPLAPIGQEHDKKKLEIKALYSTGNTAGNTTNKENIDAYRAYIKAIIAKDSKKTAELLQSAGKANNFERIIAIAAETEINGLVINVKDDNGFITYQSNVEIVKDMNLDTAFPIKNISEMLKILDEYDIYTIGRIVTFKDKHLALTKPEHAIQLKTGGTWLDPNSGKIPWVNPFDKYVWDYNLSIAKEAALLGFDEIQFDYVRFPDGAKKYNPITEFPGREGRDKDEAIGDFLEYAKKELEPYNINIGADVFGLITRTWDDYPEDIGQNWLEIGKYVDDICPMIYPSHYSTGWYDLDNPNAEPYLVVKGALQEAQEKNSSMKNPPVIRAWIQDFDWAGIEYGPKQIREQIIAAKELGLNEYMVWNPSNKYDPYCFIESDAEKKVVYPLDKGELDYREKTPADAANKYLGGKLNGLYSHMYLMTPVNEREDDFDKYVEVDKAKNIKLLHYEVTGYAINPSDKNAATVNLSYKYELTSDGKTQIIDKNAAEWMAIREKGIWKIKAQY